MARPSRVAARAHFGRRNQTGRTPGSDQNRTCEPGEPNMSGHGGSKKTASTRVIQALSLLVTFGVLYGVTRVTPELESHLGTVTAIGFLLLAGTLLSELLETIGLPHLSGY